MTVYGQLLVAAHHVLKTLRLDRGDTANASFIQNKRPSSPTWGNAPREGESTCTMETRDSAGAGLFLSLNYASLRCSTGWPLQTPMQKSEDA